MMQHRAASHVVTLCGLCAISALQRMRETERAVLWQHNILNTTTKPASHLILATETCLWNVTWTDINLIQSLTRNFGHLAHGTPIDEHQRLHCSCRGPHPKACAWVCVAAGHSACATGSSDTYGLGCLNTTLSATPCSRCLQAELRPNTSACSPLVLQPARQIFCLSTSLLACYAGDVRQAYDRLYTCFC